MRTTIAAIAAAALFAAVPAPGRAQVSVGPKVAYHSDADLGLGVMVQAPLPSLADQVGVLGDFTYFFPSAEGLNFFEVNGNLTWDVPLENSAVAPFALGGLNIARASVDAPAGYAGPWDASSTDVGLNVGAGVSFSAGSLRPMVGVRAEISGGDGVAVFGAVPFSVGN